MITEGTTVARFTPFAKIPRLNRDMVVTEKIDGTNASVEIGEDGSFRVGSRTRYITPTDDNHGFARWAYEHQEELMGLGVGQHFGEWWGAGIQRGYGLPKGDKRFSLFNVTRWADGAVVPRPACCGVVPVLYAGLFDTFMVNTVVTNLQMAGSSVAPRYMLPEGVVVFHVQSQLLFKVTILNDTEYKGQRR